MQRDFSDEGVGPQPCMDRLFRHRIRPLLDEQLEQVECLLCEPDLACAAPHAAGSRVNANTAELEHALWEVAQVATLVKGGRLMRSLAAASLVVTAMMALPSETAWAGQDAHAPRVEMRGAHGRQVRLADFKDQVVVVDLWASWCAPCKESFSALDALYREYRSRGVEVIAVNLDERRRDADAFLVIHPHEMLVTFDPTARMLKAFGAPGVPSTYVIDRRGMIRYRDSGRAAENQSDLRRALDLLVTEAASVTTR
jgi:thiol-disulfide isomerase/thioredoxin